MTLSIVTTLYRSGAFIAEFYERAVAAASRIVDSFEIIFVNDGSPDNSLAIAISIANRDPRVRVVDLSRNFGHHIAAFAGLKQAVGERIFLLDVDLEEQPEWLERFWTAYEEGSADVVYGYAEQRNGSLVKKLTGRIFYKVFNLVSETHIPENLCTVRLMSREYRDALANFSESNMFLAGLCAWAGFRQIPIAVDKRRRVGKSSYSLLRMARLFLAAITSFSSYPLWIVFVLGVMLTFASFAGGGYLVVRKLMNPSAVLLGYASVIVSIWFVGGLIILFLGIIGLYLAGVFVETKRRPQYLIRRIYGAGARTPLPQTASVKSDLERLRIESTGPKDTQTSVIVDRHTDRRNANGSI